MSSQWLFRPSSLDKILTSTGALATTEACKKELVKMFVKAKYGREEEVSSKYMTKGTEQEDDSISMYRQSSQRFIAKNSRKLANGYLQGTPDVLPELDGDTFKTPLLEFKTAYSLHTFFAQNEKTVKKNYYWQVFGYAWLTSQNEQYPETKLVYCCPSMREDLLYDEVRKATYSLGDEEYQKAEEKIRHLYTYNDIPLSERVKVFDFEYDFKKLIPTVQETLDKAREILDNF